MGSTGDSPVPVGDPPTGTSKAEPSRRLSLFAADALPIPPGESPDGTGQWPVLPKTQFPNTLSAVEQVTHNSFKANFTIFLSPRAIRVPSTSLLADPMFRPCFPCTPQNA